jgi:hypothetical protein
MSNCHFVAWRSLIALVATRLALSTPALSALSAVTRAKINQRSDYEAVGTEC